MELKRHPLSAAWPDMADEDFQSMRDSISDSGQLEPIVLLDGEVLDGWQRYRACLAEGVEPKTEVFAGEDPVAFVRSKHTRRPLNLTQRLTAIHLMAAWRPAGRPANSAPGAAYLPSASVVAKQEGASQRTVEQVRSAVKKGSPELVEAMKGGKVSAKRAEQIAKLPQEQQPAALATPPAKAVEVTLSGSADVIAHLQDQVHTLTGELEAANEQIASLEAIVASDDKAAEALADAKRWRELATGLQSRVSSMTDEIADLKRQLKAAKKKAGVDVAA